MQVQQVKERLDAELQIERPMERKGLPAPATLDLLDPVALFDERVSPTRLTPRSDSDDVTKIRFPTVGKSGPQRTTDRVEKRVPRDRLRGDSDDFGGSGSKPDARHERRSHRHESQGGTRPDGEEHPKAGSRRGSGADNFNPFGLEWSSTGVKDAYRAETSESKTTTSPVEGNRRARLETGESSLGGASSEVWLEDAPKGRPLDQAPASRQLPRAERARGKTSGSTGFDDSVLAALAALPEESLVRVLQQVKRQRPAEFAKARNSRDEDALSSQASRSPPSPWLVPRSPAAVCAQVVSGSSGTPSMDLPFPPQTTPAVTKDGQLPTSPSLDGASRTTRSPGSTTASVEEPLVVDPIMMALGESLAPTASNNPRDVVRTTKASPSPDPFLASKIWPDVPRSIGEAANSVVAPTVKLWKNVDPWAPSQGDSRTASKSEAQVSPWTAESLSWLA
uniref:Uncharacterized protein n=1 Tax=Noctiluca scintillans TaxID=2966 RepID=A0A7S1APH0_NOCSC